MRKILIMAGGGIKSAVAAARCAKEHSLVLLHLDYGQPSVTAEHKAIVGLLPAFPDARLMRLSLPHVLELNRGVIEHSKPGVIQAAPLQAQPDKESSPVLPASLRGFAPVLLSVGVQAAMRLSAEKVVVGLTRFGFGGHLGLAAEQDAHPRPELVHAFAVACNVGLGALMKIETPLMDLTYVNLIQLGLRLDVPFEHTWSCQVGGSRPCERCETCRQRQRAFAELGRVDPLLGGARPRPARAGARA